MEKTRSGQRTFTARGLDRHICRWLELPPASARNAYRLWRRPRCAFSRQPLPPPSPAERHALAARMPPALRAVLGLRRDGDDDLPDL